MRGIKAVLYVAVLVCLISSAFAQCGQDTLPKPTGKVSADASTCVCASSYVLPNCAAKASGSCSGVVPSKTEANHFPSLSTASGATSFVANTLNAVIEAEYVVNRQYEEIKFTPLTAQTPEEPKCNLGTASSFWTQASRLISGSTCNDSFTLAMPWAMHPACGFKNDTKLSDGDYMYITGLLHIKYTDDLDEVENFTLTRSTKVPYSITVKFQKHVTVKLLALNVSSDVKFGMALTEDVYDPVSQILTLELTTIVNWPNMFYTGKEKVHIYMPDQVTMLEVDSSNGRLCTDPLADCVNNDKITTYPQTLENTCDPQAQDSICKQSFTWQSKIIPNAPNGMNCSFDGTYKLNIGLYTCRGAGGPSLEPECTNELTNITYTIQDSYVCGEIGVVPSVGGKLYAFDPQYTSGFRALVAAGNKDTTHFTLGTYGHFYAKIDSDDNLISLNFTNIRFKTQETGATYTNLYDTGSNTHSLYIQVFDNSKYFRIYFHSSTFRVNPNSQVVYTFSATCEIAFEGNPNYIASPELKKRTVEYTWTQANAEAQTNVFMAPASTTKTTPAESVQTPAGVSSVTFIASVVGAVAGTMIIVFVVVGLALRARSGKEQETSASLMAASAAASEVANRA